MHALPQALVKNRCSSKTGHGEGDAAQTEHCGQGFAGKEEHHPAAEAGFFGRSSNNLAFVDGSTSAGKSGGGMPGEQERP